MLPYKMCDFLGRKWIKLPSFVPKYFGYLLLRLQIQLGSILWGRSTAFEDCSFQSFSQFHRYIYEYLTKSKGFVMSFTSLFRTRAVSVYILVLKGFAGETKQGAKMANIIINDCKGLHGILKDCKGMENISIHCIV